LSIVITKTGAHDWTRTSDLSLTKGVLYRLSYVGRDVLERVIGIEPTSSAWKAEVLPLNYTRLETVNLKPSNPALHEPESGGGGRIRTCEG
jgi:hypothetical protein